MSESLIVGTVLSAPEAGWQRINNTTTTNGFSYTKFYHHFLYRNMLNCTSHYQECI